ncbi:MAG: YwaF family protein [Acholeplasmataceae bacterium]|mgnify:CR=1 FL=1|nr:YwaF family protein [Acholeplasmataceae bacterium]
MKQFIDYFWFQEGFSYDPLEDPMFSIYHIIMLLLCIVVVIVFWIIGKKIKNKNTMLIAIAIILFVLEALRVINILEITNTTLVGAISFHLCAIGVYLMIIACLFRKKWMFEAVFFHSLVGAPTAVIIPYGILQYYNEYSFLPVQSYITHTLLWITIIYAWKYRFFNISYKRIFIPLVSVFLSAVLAYVMSNINLKYHTGGSVNFFWTRYKDPMFEKYLHLPHPYYILVIIGLLFIGGLFGYHILKQFEKRKIIRK